MSDDNTVIELATKYYANKFKDDHFAYAINVFNLRYGNYEANK